MRKEKGRRKDFNLNSNRKRTRRDWKKERKRRSRKKFQGGFLIGILLVITLGIGGTFLFIHHDNSVEVSTSDNSADKLVDDSKMETEVEIEKEAEVEMKLETEIVEELIAEYTINNPNSSANRNSNLATAADIINRGTGGTDGYILDPGKKFSALETLGEITEEKGFKAAPEYQNGQLVNGIGGGICQITTTTNSAIQQTEQSTDEEYLHAEPHSITLRTGKPPAYINPERGDKEASIARSVWKDFYFISTLEYSIRIQILTDNGSVRVRIFSRKEIPKIGAIAPIFINCVNLLVILGDNYYK